MNFGPNPDWTPFFSHFWSRLTMCIRLRRSPDRSNSNQTRDPQSFGHVFKRCLNSIKIGMHSPFGLRFPIEFEAFFKKNWTGLVGSPKKLVRMVGTGHLATPLFCCRYTTSGNFLLSLCLRWLAVEPQQWSNAAQLLRWSLKGGYLFTCATVGWILTGSQGVAC